MSPLVRPAPATRARRSKGMHPAASRPQRAPPTGRTSPRRESRATDDRHLPGVRPNHPRPCARKTCTPPKKAVPTTESVIFFLSLRSRIAHRSDPACRPPQLTVGSERPPIEQTARSLRSPSPEHSVTKTSSMKRLIFACLSIALLTVVGCKDDNTEGGETKPTL